MITTTAAREKSRRKRQLLRDPVVSTAFHHYFRQRQNWQAREVLDKLQSLGADVELLRECALYSFHPLGQDEAEEKRKRGERRRSCLKKAIAGYKSAMEVYSWHMSAPHHDDPDLRAVGQRSKELYKANEYLAKEASAWLERTAKNRRYTTKRLGVNWQSSYLFLMKSYIERLGGWEEARILEAMTHLIAAAHKSLNFRVPHDLRALLRKAIRGFENDSRNADIIMLLRHSAGDSKTLYEMFQPLGPHST
jgi:hypothetical protein